MGRTLHIEYGELPPSDNSIRGISYRFFSGKKQAVIVYTKEANDYKKAFTRHVNDQYFGDVQDFTRGHRPHMVYRMTLVLSFPAGEILNAGWLHVARDGTRGTKTPYKMMDVMNRRKLIEDCIAEAIGIDDSLFWEAETVKQVAASAKVFVLLEEADPRSFHIPGEYLR